MDQINIDRDGAIPLHVQLLNQLRHFILSGQWAPGSRIPSEPELRNRLNISRSTIRQALANAEAEGLITRVPGKGTFVAAVASDARNRRLIGYITGNCSGPMQSRILSGAERVAAARGYRIIFGNSNGDTNEESRLLDQLVHEDKVVGIIIWPVLRDKESGRVFQLARAGMIPVVAVDRTYTGLQCDFVSSDNYAGGYAAVEHLLGQGHRRIVFLSQPILRLITVSERFRGYQDAMCDGGLTPLEPWLVGSSAKELDIRGAAEGIQDAHGHEIAEIVEHLGCPSLPTAIVAINDTMAIQAMTAARSLGMAVPEDLSVVGFDDISVVNALLDTPLTTVAQDPYTMGKRATELLIERIEGYSGSPRQEFLPTELRVRASTTPPAAFRTKSEPTGTADNLDL
jgi:GntR family transcriptional regulator of arabinose operon